MFRSRIRQVRRTAPEQVVHILLELVDGAFRPGLQRVLEFRVLPQLDGMVRFAPPVVVRVVDVRPHTVQDLAAIQAPFEKDQVHEPSGFLGEPAHVMHVPVVQRVVDDGGQRVDAQQLLEHDEPADPAVAVGERVYLLEHPMRAGYLIGIVLEIRVDVEQPVHRLRNVFGQGHARRRGHIADDVGLRLVSSDVVYGFVGLSCAVLEYGVQVADEVLVHGLVGMVEDPAERDEVVPGLDRVVDADAFRPVHGERSGVEDLGGLPRREGGSLHVVGVPRELQLGGHVDAVGVARIPFRYESFHDPAAHCHAPTDCFILPFRLMASGVPMVSFL